MGTCHDFGVDIRAGCGHPMQANESSCACPECGVVCEGRFKGCPDVWARGPRPVQLASPGRANDHPNGSTQPEGLLTLTVSPELAGDGGRGEGLAAGARAQTAPRVDLRDSAEVSVERLHDDVRALASAIAAQRAMLQDVVEAVLGLRPLIEAAPQAMVGPLVEAVRANDHRMTERLAMVVSDLGNAVQAADAAAAQDRRAAAEGETARWIGLNKSMLALGDSVRAIHALATAQGEKIHLLDETLAQVQQSFLDIEATAARRHDEVRDELAEHRQSTSASLTKQLRSLSGSLPELVAAGAVSAAHATAASQERRLDLAVEELSRSMGDFQAAVTRQQHEAVEAEAARMRAFQEAVTKQLGSLTSVIEAATSVEKPAPAQKVAARRARKPRTTGTATTKKSARPRT